MVQPTGKGSGCQRGHGRFGLDDQPQLETEFMSETGTVRAGEVEISREQLLGQMAVLDGEAPAIDTASTTTSDNAAEEPRTAD